MKRCKDEKNTCKNNSEFQNELGSRKNVRAVKSCIENSSCKNNRIGSCKKELRVIKQEKL